MKQDRALLGGIAAVFLACAAVTVVGCRAMTMPGMPMPWVRMPDQTWSGAAAEFLGMWTVMMVAMMLPAITPQLVWHRRAFGTRRTLAFALQYFAIWVAVGALVYPAGALFMAAVLHSATLSEGLPWISNGAILLTGVVQLTRWKRRALDCCRRSRWHSGLQLGLRCVACCANVTLLLLVLGVMDLRAMALVTVIILIERLGPRGLLVRSATM